MLYMKCEYCVCFGVIKSKNLNEEDIINVCPLCLGIGYHREPIEGNIDSLRRWSVLRTLDLIYVEYKNKERVKRLMELFYIVPLPDEPELTAASELVLRLVTAATESELKDGN